MKKVLLFFFLVFVWFCSYAQTPITLSKVTINSDVATSVTNFTDITSLSFPVTSGNTYWFMFVIGYTTDATTTGSGWAVNGPAMTAINWQLQSTLNISAVTTRYCSALDCGGNSASSGGGLNTTLIIGTCKPSANGTVIGRFSSEITTPGTVTVKADNTVLFWQQIK